MLHRSSWLRAAAHALVFAALALAHARPARANDPRAERLPAAYIPAGSELSYVAVRAPLPARQLGVIALAGLEKLARPSVEVPSVLGAAPDDTPPPGWPGALLAASASRGPTPLAASRDDGSCACATSLGPVRDERVAVLFATRAFQVGHELERMRLLRLRARYEDSLVAYINGREVARRNLPADAAPMAVAERPHGPEWETFYIPVVPGLLRRGENILAVEVRPSGHRTSPYLDLALEPAEGARIVRGPMLQRVGPDSATLVFETDQPLTGQVEYGATPALGQVARSAGGGLALRHVVELRDLPTSAAVHYRIVAGDITTPAAVFHTAPRSGDVVRIAVYGDVRGGHDVHGQLVQAMLDEAPDFALVTGDLVMRGSDEGDWQRFFEVTGPLIARVPFYPAAGNHDTGRSGDQALRMNEIFELWPGPEDRPEWGHWYSFDVSDIHLVMLDSNAYDSRAQLEWLERDLEAARARGTRAIFAVAHDGPFSRGIHQGNPTALEHYVPVLRRHDVTMMFTGHDHLYQRGDIDGFRYIVSGGGGAPLYSVRCGNKGQPRCRTRDGMRHVTSEHHYIMVTVYRTHIEICPKRADGSLLEPCLSLRARK